MVTAFSVPFAWRVELGPSTRLICSRKSRRLEYWVATVLSSLMFSIRPAATSVPSSMYSR